MKLKSERDSVHSQNSFLNNEDFRIPSGISKTTPDTKSMSHISRPIPMKPCKRGVVLMTQHLLEFYKKCSPSYQYDPNTKPHRILTEIPENCYEFFNNGNDLPNGDYIIKKDDIIISPEGTEYLIEELIGKGTFGQVIKCK